MWSAEDGRCVHEYTPDDLEQAYRSFSASAVSTLRRFPCIFGYETFLNRDPRFGRLRTVRRQSSSVYVEFEIVPVQNFLTHTHLASMSSELNLGSWELTRTHWAVKYGDLARLLVARGIVLPPWAFDAEPLVDVTSHVFDVALSFPGEARTYVEAIAGTLKYELGVNRCFILLGWHIDF